MIGRGQISLRLTLVAMLMLATSMGLLRANADVHSVVLGLIGFLGLGISIGWPIGFLVGGRPGAVIGGIFGILFLFGAMFAYIQISLRNTPDF